MKDGSLKHQNILVTGASRGIGEAISSYLLKQGATVALHYHRQQSKVIDLQTEFGADKALIFQADFSNSQEVSGLWERMISKMKRIDAVVINAGVFIEHPISLDSEEWMDLWNKTMMINLNSQALLVKLALPHFKYNKNGRFIFISSRAAFKGETREYLGYAASKGGLLSLSRSVARSFGKQGIKSFAIAPGFVKTEMIDKVLLERNESDLIEELALNELTAPEHIAPLVGILCSGLMDHATGTTIDMNAGSHIH